MFTVHYVPHCVPTFVHLSKIMLRVILYEYNVITPFIPWHSDLDVHSKHYHIHIENIISSPFSCCCLSGH